MFVNKMRMGGTTLCLSLLLIFSIAFLAQAGTTGTISGVVIDKQTGSPVAYAAVRIPNLGLGGFTDGSGYFTIIGVPAGEWDVTAELVGYKTSTVNNVVVKADKRTDITVNLISEALTGYEITTYSEPLIRKDIMSTERTMTSSEIERSTIDAFTDIMQRTAGIISEGTTEGGIGSGGSYHVRGGRDSEMVYVVDGITVSNPLYGGSGMYINTNAIEQMSILTGGWDAQYGEAQSAVVNIVTKEGSDKHSGNFTYTQDLWQQRYEWDSMFRLASTGQPDPDQPLITWHTTSRQERRTKLGASLGGPLSSKISYFVSGEWQRSWTRFPVKDPTIDWDASLKLAFKFTEKSKLTLSGGYSNLKQDRFRVKWQYYLGEGYLDQKREQWRGSLKFTQYLGESSFFSVNFGRVNRFVKANAPGAEDLEIYKIDAGRDLEDQRYLTREQLDATGFFYTRGGERWWEEYTTYYYLIDGDFTSQLSKRNEFKCGAEYKWYNLDYYSVQPLPSNTYNNIYIAKPKQFSAYAQDKMEYKSMVLNLGVRFDLFDASEKYLDDPFNFYDPDKGWGYNQDSEYSTFEELYEAEGITPSVKWKFSPRVGFSFPVTENDKFHFAYGHFFQIPPFQYLYMSTQRYPIGAYPLLGYPDLEPEQTIQYEFGIEHIFTENMVGDATVFIKKIKNLLDTHRVEAEYGTYSKTTNADYGSSRGFELTLSKRLSNMFAFDVGYTFSVAKGLASSYRQGYDYAYYGWVLPRQENYLDWDQRHTINASFDLRDVNKWGVNVSMVYGSGAPYSTPVETGQPEINNLRMPWTLNIDTRFNYDLSFGGMKYTFFVEAKNITSLFHKNVVYLGHNEGEGDAEDYTLWLNDYDDPDGPWDDIETYDTPCTLRAGVTLSF
jgi:outer membrane receptor protein involved in Fe transport